MIDSGSEQPAGSPPVPRTGILIAIDEDPQPRIPVLPKRFFPPIPRVTPQILFPDRVVCFNDHLRIHRFIGAIDSAQFLVYADGACFDNGRDKPKAGWAFVFKDSTSDRPTKGRISGRLETTALTGEARRPTGRRAELRAVIAALQYLYKDCDTFESVVVATDSAYVVNNAIRLLGKWSSNGWTNLSGNPVQNKDLWQDLLRAVEGWAKKNREVYLWRIHPDWNGEADRFARLAVTSRPLPIDFGELRGYY
ncbi:ribonuclease H-like protein [Aspergillus sclerotiicarbonarius CBS 121057]|uniref:ribonuclease H n=1 Tax=Aspergillus sclerotiicarbonarius (strain CBS 121057 / IBT 28362) TaxID=1448318 RepID=A0A319ESV4_ASPSB|nr:ribonuclease H-like protein [Aspergillus sclerotiicarbonarius CBS 121057]